MLIGENEWKLIELPPGRNLSLGSGFERGLDDAGRKFVKLTNCKSEVRFYFRGNVYILDEIAGLRPMPHGDGRYELKVRCDDDRSERAFIVHTATGESEWVTDFSKAAVPR